MHSLRYVWVLAVLATLALTSLAGLQSAPASPVDTGWGTSVAIDVPQGRADFPDLAVEPSGDAVAVWVQNGAIYARHYSAEEGWQDASKLAEGDFLGRVQVAISANGMALVLWTDSGTYASVFEPGEGWGARKLITRTREAHLAMDPEGNAIVVLPGAYLLRAEHYLPGVGWEYTRIEGSGYGREPRVAMDSQGKAIVVWHQDGHVYASRFDPSEGWGTPSAINTGPGRAYGGLRVAVAPQGSAVATWRQLEGNQYHLYANQFDPATGWATATRIDAGPTSAYSPQVALDGSGNAFAVWQEPEGIYANRFIAGLGWGSAVAISANAESPDNPRVAVDPDGSAIAVWHNWDGARHWIQASRFVPSRGWSIPTAIDSGNGGDLLRAAIDSSGNAMVLWVGPSPSGRVFVNRFTVEYGWSQPDIIDTGPLFVDGPQIATNARGDTISTWIEWTRDGCAISANRFLPASGWQDGASISFEFTEFCGAGDVAMDGLGNAMAVWTQGEGGPSVRTVYANRFAPASGWGIATELGRGRSPSIAVDQAGNAMAVWEGYWGIHGRRFVPDEGWDSVVDLDVRPGSPSWLRGPPYGPRIASDSVGNAILVWIETTGLHNSLYTRSFSPMTGWGSATSLGADRFASSVAVDPEGNALVISEVDGGISALRFAPSTEWREETLLSLEGKARTLDAVVDPSGNAVVIWIQEDGPDRSLYASRFVPTRGWEDARPINLGADAGGGLVTGRPRVTVDSQGNAVAVWEQYDGAWIGCYCAPSVDELNVYANRFVPGAGWQTATLLVTGGETPAVAMDGSGNAVSVWRQSDGIYANRFVRGTGAPDLTILSPLSSLTNSNEVVIEGLTHPGVDVAVDGVQVAVDARGSFSLTKTLSEGTHTLEVVAANAAGRTTTTRVEVTVDTTAPLLLLTTPAQGSATEFPTVLVAGTTEPGAHLVINEVVVNVRSDGSFSFHLPLAEGTNVITATSSDVAGNHAMATVTVRHANPVPSLRLTAGVQLVILAVLLTAVVGLSLLHFGTSSVSRVLGLGKGLRAAGKLKRHNETTHRWPATSGRDTLHLTTKERILLHLLDFAQYNGRQEVPLDLTQPGIAAAASVDLRHFAQYIRPLVREGLVRESTEHVKGVLQRRKVYLLSESGMRRALGIRERIQGVRVQVRDSAGVREASIREVLATAPQSPSVLDVVREAVLAGVVDLRS